MLKKYVGGLTLLVFTLTFVVPLFVGVNTADAGPTSILKQRWRTDFYCPDGSYATSSSGAYILSESYDNHPEDRCGWVVIRGGIFGEPPVWRWLCFHREHEAPDVDYSEENDITTVTIQNNPIKCPDDDEDEATAN